MSSNKRQRRQVLPEEEYSSHLSQIIQRDYFPDIPQLESKLALQERREVGDFAGAIAVRKVVRKLQEQEEEQQQQEQAAEKDANDGVRRTARPLHRETVTGFHSRVTSEDNAEFIEEQKKEVEVVRKRRHDYLMLTNYATESTRQSTRAKSPQLLLASDEFNSASSRPKQARKDERSSLFFAPATQSASTNTAAKDQPRLLTNGLQSTDDASKLLMPPPSGITRKQDLVEYTPRADTERRIQPEATRFPHQIIPRVQSNFEEADDDESSTADDSSDSSTDLDESVHASSLRRERLKAMNKRKKENETFVPMSPLTTPGVSAVQFASRSESSSPTHSLSVSEVSFAFPEESSRDKARTKAQAGLDARSKRRRAAGTSKHKSADKKLASLFDSSSRPSSARSGSAFSTALRASYTPAASSRSSRSHSRSQQRDSVHNATPRIIGRPESTSR
jgi:protein DGCR14